MNLESALAEVMMLELLSGAIQMKHIKMIAQRKRVTFPKSFVMWDCVSFKGQGEMAINTSTINVHVYFQILDDFLIQLIENWFGEGVILLDNNASC